MAPAPSLTELIQTVNDRSADQDALTARRGRRRGVG